MKYKISYTIRLHTIEDSILKELQSYMIELKILSEYCDFIKLKYDIDFYNEETKNYLLNNFNDPFTEFFDYNSIEHEKILHFFIDKGLFLNHNIIKSTYAIIEYDKNDYIDCEYFKLFFHYESNISEKCININNQKMKPINLTENFIIFDNSENLICNKNIVNKVQFQEYNTGYANIYFISKSLGEFLKNNNFTGFELFPVKQNNTNEIIFYQLKVTNLIEQPSIKTEISSLFNNTKMMYPSEASPLHNYYKKRNDICIYDKQYMLNDFKDFNVCYFSFANFNINSNHFLTRPEIIVSKRVMLLLKQYKSKFTMTPIYSTNNVAIDTFNLNKEIKQLILIASSIK